MQNTTIRPRWRRLLRRIALGMAGLVLLALVGNTVWGRVEARRLREEIDKIKSAGEPLTFADLDARLPKVDEADDAGPYYEAALAVLRHKDDEKLWDAYDTYCTTLINSPSSRPAEEVRRDIDRLLADNALTLQMLDLAGRRPACRFKLGVEAGIQHCLPRFSRARRMARLLSLQAFIHVSANRPDEAVDSLVCLLRMLRMFDQQAITIAHLTKVAIACLACSDVKTVLEIGRPSEAKMAFLQQALLAIDVPRPLEPVMLAERVCGIELMMMSETPATKVLAGVPRDPMVELSGASVAFWRRPMYRYLAVGYLRDMDRLLQETRRPLPQALSAIQDGGPPKSLLGGMACPALSRNLILAEQTTAQVRCAAVAVAIERCRRATGRLPGSLQDLVPAYAATRPVDPFTGAGLIYRHDDKSYVVYSLGENQKDDNGSLDPTEEGGPPDFGIRIRLSAGQ